MTPDYSSYSDQELQQVKYAIDKEAYPERYQTLCAEIAQRQQAAAEAAAPLAANVRQLRPIGVGEYVIGGLGFFPFLGLPLSIIALVWGLTTKRKDGKTLALVGGLGIVYFVLLCVMVFIQYHQLKDADADIVDEPTVVKMEPTPAAAPAGDIDEIARLIELYHYRQGQYPESLDDVKAAFPLAQVSYVDSSNSDTTSDFIYQRNTDGYQLLGVGNDGIASTDDDLHPIKGPQY
ncbi:hypothetical protein [Shewanella sp.]|uniref:hypothetical protein n=1 Tax=Shewanella sp. TaxID=50422 RepID=UPI003A9839D0